MMNEQSEIHRGDESLSNQKLSENAYNSLQMQ